MGTGVITAVLQVIVGLGLLNVWILRRDRPTAYRGGSSTDLRGEFAAYGLPPIAYPVVGTLKVVAALVLLVGVVVEMPVRIAAAVIAALMVSAVAMHLKVRDPLMRALPATAMLVMSLAILLLPSLD